MAASSENSQKEEGLGILQSSWVGAEGAERGDMRCHMSLNFKARLKFDHYMKLSIVTAELKSSVFQPEVTETVMIHM